MRDLILHVLKLILRISFKLILDTFHKSFGITIIFAEEVVRFLLGYNNISLFFLSMPAFILCPASANIITKKRGHKKSTIVSISFSCIEMVFALLAKPVVI